MKRFLSRCLVIVLLSLLPNLIIGILRFNAGDPIPYYLNREKSHLTKSQTYSLANKRIYSIPKGDLSKQPLLGTDSVLKIFDQFGFSNVVENKSPEILLIGDSYLDNNRENAFTGFQALINKKLNGNIAFNIGGNGCSGFKVYNELNESYFKSKPKLIVLEVVERLAQEVIISLPSDLKERKVKTKKYKYFYVDLILGNNFSNIGQSNLFSKNKNGFTKDIQGEKIWFLSNKPTIYPDSILNQMVNSMKLTESILEKEGIKVMFVIAPDKETMYPQVFGKSSLEKLYAEMKNQKLLYINTDSLFKSQDRKFFYDGDTHWNQNAIKTITDQISEKYKELYPQLIRGNHILANKAASL